VGYRTAMHKVVYKVFFPDNIFMTFQRFNVAIYACHFTIFNHKNQQQYTDSSLETKQN